MKKTINIFFAFLILFKVQSQTYPHSNIFLLGHIDPEIQFGVDSRKYSGCWGWHQDSTTKGTSKIYSNKEYALVGSSAGTYFMDISAPATPTVCDYVPGTRSGCTWREIKTYKNYCYVVSDDAKPNTFQIIDMQYLPDSVHVVYNDSSYFERSHTIWIDGDKLYCGGVTTAAGVLTNMKVYSLATPTAPVFLRSLEDDYPFINYVHDMYVRNDTIYASCGWQGLHVFKFNSGVNTFTALGSLTSYAESGYNHSSYITPDGKTLVFCDEVPAGLSLKIADVSNLTNINLPAITKPNANNDFVAHNPYVISNRWAFASCYQDGLLLYDISVPANPVLAGYFDTHPQGGANAGNNYGGAPYRGNWGAYPFFASGLVVACDMQNGVFVLDPTAMVGINNSEKHTQLAVSVFPNPAGDKLYLNIKNDYSGNFYSFKIKNMLGQTVLEKSETLNLTSDFNETLIDVSQISAGVYMLFVNSANKTFQQKIIISK